MNSSSKQAEAKREKREEKTFQNVRKESISVTKKAGMMEMKKKCGPKSFKGKGGGSSAEKCKCQVEENDTTLQKTTRKRRQTDKPSGGPTSGGATSGGAT